MPALPARSVARVRRRGPARRAWCRAALRLISDGALDREGVEALADRLGVTARHLRRLFVQHLGATPIEVALTRRVHFAKKLIDETRLPMAQIAFAAGLRQPAAIQRRDAADLLADADRAAPAGAQANREPSGYRFRLAYRPPYDWQQVIGFLAARATPGVELVEADRYQRTIAIGDTTGTIAIGPAAEGPALILDVQFGDPRALLDDRRARPADVRSRRRSRGDRASSCRRCAAAPRGGRARRHSHAGRVGSDSSSPCARSSASRSRCAAATTIAGRMAGRWGTPVEGIGGAQPRCFPHRDQLADAPLEEAGIISARADDAATLARAVRDGAVVFDGVSTARGARARFPASASGRRSTSRCARSTSRTHFRPAISC